MRNLFQFRQSDFLADGAVKRKNAYRLNTAHREI